MSVKVFQRVIRCSVPSSFQGGNTDNWTLEVAGKGMDLSWANSLETLSCTLAFELVESCSYVLGEWPQLA